ncbi:ribosome silencing factor [uncultured Campylobacter sp.]|uniref:ribosome silencing factor n=1 Tax=uncultured Campylobacter sp. TaxID=218934 RepID=UPI002610E11F|nr:ribosome silencing factor [uncultured Campylobacter sp.]
MMKRVEKIVKILEDKKAENIEILDMRDSEYFVSFVVLATTLAQKHAASLIDELKTKLKADNESFLNIESSDEWTVLDLGDVLIHLLSEEYRELYDLESFLKSLKK